MSPPTQFSFALSSSSAQDSSATASNEGPIRRNILAKSGLISSFPDTSIQTLWDIVPYAAKKYKSKKALGTRKVLRTEIDPKTAKSQKPMLKYELGPYEYLTFEQVLEHTKALGSGLRHFGLEPEEKFQLFARTSANWLLIALGASSQRLVLTTAYDTLGEDGLKFALNQTEASGIYTEADLLPHISNIASEVPKLKLVIFNGELTDASLTAHDNLLNHQKLNVVHYNDLLSYGQKHPSEPQAPGPDDLACIMYTSGSTGHPKGVILRHRNVISTVSGIDRQVGDVLTPEDYLLCFLPLAHILEFVFESAALYWGTTLGYANIRTLTKANVLNCKGDIQEFRPTIMVGVPAVWELVRKGILSEVSNSSSFKRAIFWNAYKLKSFFKRYNLPGCSLCDMLVFNKVSQATGGRLRYVLSGGAPLADVTRQFISICICPVLLGYGLTETCAAASVTHPSMLNSKGTSTHAIGPPLPCLDMKLVDSPEAGYFAAPSHHHPNRKEQGEIYIRGASVSEGYYKNEAETELSFVDGWFRTGDIGEWSDNGQIAIIDRCKNLVKMLNGEYIALEKLESIYRSCWLVSNVCVFADQTQRKPVALIVPHEQNLIKLAHQEHILPDDKFRNSNSSNPSQNQGTSNVDAKGNDSSSAVGQSNQKPETDSQHDMELLCKDERIRKLVFQALLHTGHTNKLCSAELVQAVLLRSEEFTVENGLVTSTQKLQRKKIFEIYKHEIQQIYDKAA